MLIGTIVDGLFEDWMQPETVINCQICGTTLFADKPKCLDLIMKYVWFGLNRNILQI